MSYSKIFKVIRNKGNFSHHTYGKIFLAILCTITLAGCGKKDDHAKAAKPNIIVILADDMGYGDPGCYNPDSKIPTPNIDRLAEQGMRFTDAHAAAAWCVPSRYGLLTGKYPFRTRLNWRDRSIIESGQRTLATLLKSRGYRTGMVGKWHQGFDNYQDWVEQGYQGALHGGPLEHGFDFYYGIPASLDIPPYFYIQGNHAVRPPTDSIGASHTKGVTEIQGAFWRAGKIAPGFKHADVLPRLTEKALSFIDRHRTGQDRSPFFLYFALTAPHTPWLPSQKFKGSSQAGLYGDFVNQVDEVVGQMMDKLHQQGISENTIVIFTSDNGPVWFREDAKRYDHYSTAMLRGMKIDSWEGGHRVPFIVRWPGKVKAGTTNGALLDFTDMVATLAAASGDTLSETKARDSYNQLPVWEGAESEVRTVLPIEQTIRRGSWKLILGSGLGGLHRHYGNSKAVDENMKGELYNLEEDISEKNNLYEQDSGKVKQLEKLMDKIKE